MSDPYLGFKFAHVLIAIIALGAAATLGVLLGLFAEDPVHGLYVLRVVRKLAAWIVAPGYVLMLVTGMWMGHLGGLLDAHWAEAAMNLWGFGALGIGTALFALRRQIELTASGAGASTACRRARWLARISAVASGAVILAILHFMVFKPGP